MENKLVRTSTQLSNLRKGLTMFHTLSFYHLPVLGANLTVPMVAVKASSSDGVLDNTTTKTLEVIYWQQYLNMTETYY